MRCNIQKVLGQTVSCSYPSRIKQRWGKFLQEFLQEGKVSCIENPICHVMKLSSALDVVLSLKR